MLSAGASFILERQKLTEHPHTLLGSMDLQKFYRPDLSAYYFDRNREAFDAVVNYYLSGERRNEYLIYKTHKITTGYCTTKHRRETITNCPV